MNYLAAPGYSSCQSDGLRRRAASRRDRPAMYRDNTLIPSEAVRLLALGLLATRSMSYAELAREVRHFTGRIMGPSLDLVGAPLEVLKVEGLVANRSNASERKSVVEGKRVSVRVDLVGSRITK